MSRKKIFSAVLSIVLLVGLSGCTKAVSTDTATKKTAALILRSNYGYHWATVKLGAEAAAREFNLAIDYAAPDDEEDYEAQIKLVNQALERKVDAIILAANDYYALGEAASKAYSAGIPVILIDSEVDTEKMHSYIGTDDFQAGRKAAGVLVDIAGEGARVALLSFEKGSKNAAEREDGVLKTLQRYDNIEVVAKEYCLSDIKLANELTRKIIRENPDVDAVIALNETASEGAAQAIVELGLQGKVKIIAFGSTSQEINNLDKGVIQAIVIQNPFSIGYMGVKYAFDVLEKRSVPKNYLIDTKVIDKSTMYLPENQRLLFPFVK